MKKTALFPLILKCTFALLLFITGSSFAQQNNVSAPEALIRKLTNEVMKAVNDDPELQSGNINKITQLVEKKIIPYSNFDRTTQLAMGRYWDQANAEQQKKITQLFKMLLIRTYAGAISQIRDQTIQFKASPDATPNDNDAVVRTEVNNHGQSIQINYRLENTANGWKVYDLNIMGAWLIQTYRHQFAQQIQQNGIEKFIDFLSQRNQQLKSGA